MDNKLLIVSGRGFMALTLGPIGLNLGLMSPLSLIGMELEQREDPVAAA